MRGTAGLPRAAGDSGAAAAGRPVTWRAADPAAGRPGGPTIQKLRLANISAMLSPPERMLGAIWLPAR